MLEYARSDTHFLLFIYDHLRNELLDKTGNVSDESGPIFDVINNSQQTSLLRYQGHQYGSDELGTGPAGWYNMLKRSPVNLSKEQFAVFKAVHRWRDRIARQNDEGVNYVIPKYALFAIAQAMPMDLDSLLRVAPSIGQPARVRISDLLNTIKSAKAAGVNGPEMSTVLASLQKSRGGSPPPEPIRARPSRTVAAAAAAAAAAKPNGESDANMLDADGSVVLTENLPARSSVSQFWGSTFGSSIWESAAGKATTADGGAGRIQLALPLPHLTAEVFEDAQAGSPQAPRTADVADPGARAEIPFTRDRPKPRAAEDDVFIIKQLGGSRKRKATDTFQQAAAASAPRGTQQDPVLLDEDDGDEAGASEPKAGHGDAAAKKEEEAKVEEDEEKEAPSRKTKSREEKRARRLERKQLRAQAMADELEGAGRQPATHGAVADGGESAEAFDYATAAVALQADTAKARRAQPASQFKPYSGGVRGGGGADGPAAARAVRRDRAGRTMTFTK
jgi:exosome complex exonuclease RRP6